MQVPIDITLDRNRLSQHFEALISRQERMCRDLESLADDLPDRIDTLAAKMLADALHPTLRACQDLEETHVFPAILTWQASIGPTLDRLRAEHVEDEDHAAIVAEAIMRFVRSRRHAEADQLGYLLRGLFRPLMRHSAFDRDVILPLYRQALSRRD